MAFPYLYESNLDLGTTGEWDSETDTDGKLAIRNYEWLAKRLAYPDAIPYAGAFAMHIDLSGGTADAYVEETDGFDLALDGTIYIRFYFYAANLTMAASDRFALFALQSAGPVNEAVIGLINNAGKIQIVFDETGAVALGANTRTTDLVQQQWHCIEMLVALDDGGSNDGAITAFVDGRQIGAAIGSLDQAAITQARLGAIGIDAGTTAGHLLFDAVAADDTRIGPLANRYAEQRYCTKTRHAVLGQGKLAGLTLITSNADNSVTLYDTDTAITSDTSRIIYGPVQAGSVETREFDLRHLNHYFTHGCYAVLSGTNPRAIVTVAEAQDLNEGNVKALGVAR